jgi:hypothetical protein
MTAFERILWKLILVHLIMLIIIQGFFQPSPYLFHMNKLYVYEGVSSGQPEPREDL